tara:strand:+ start:693 stop:1505 length:813 start_codon:yes stop_codon:yes gene_type:complete
MDTLSELPDGIYIDIPIDKYHATTFDGELRLSSSKLKMINHSIEEYESSLSQKKQTSALAFGNLFDFFFFDEHAFRKAYSILPAEIPLNKDGSPSKRNAEYKAYRKEHPNEKHVSTAQLKVLEDMKESVFRVPKAVDLLQEGSSQKSILFTDPKTGLKCQIRPDWDVCGKRLVDLKTIRCDDFVDSSPRKVNWQIINFGYHLQNAFYMWGYEVATGVKPKDFVFIFVEKVKPYIVNLYTLDPGLIKKGYGMFRYALDQYSQYLKNRIVQH